MASTVKRKTTIRSAADLRAAMAAFGITEGDPHATTLAVSEDGTTAHLTSGKLPGTSACDDALPVAFDLAGSTVTYPAELDVAVCELLAQAVAEQVRQVARRAGHVVSITEEVARGRSVLRAVVEQPPGKLTIDIDRGGREFNIGNQGFARPKDGREVARLYEAIFG